MGDWIASSGKSIPFPQSEFDLQLRSMPWDTWQRPQAGQKVHCWQSPSLEAVDEASTTFIYTTTPTSIDQNMTDDVKGDDWGSGGATTSFNTSDEWNTGSAGADWNEGVASNNFDDGAPAGGFAGEGEGVADGAGPPGAGACFNCGQDGHMKSGESPRQLSFGKTDSCRLLQPKSRATISRHLPSL